MGPSITGSVAAGIGTHTSPRRTGVRRGDKWRGFAELNGGFRATSEGICAGHGVVPVGEGIASGLDPARKPRESPPNKSALYTARSFPRPPTVRPTRRDQRRPWSREVPGGGEQHRARRGAGGRGRSVQPLALTMILSADWWCRRGLRRRARYLIGRLRGEVCKALAGGLSAASTVGGGRAAGLLDRWSGRGLRTVRRGAVAGGSGEVLLPRRRGSGSDQ